MCPAGEPAAATDRAGAHASAYIPAAAAHTATATEPASAAHASATTPATPGFGAVDSSSRKHDRNRNRGCADMSEREH
jgi:hypothetical protein